MESISLFGVDTDSGAAEERLDEVELAIGDEGTLTLVRVSHDKY